MRPFPLIEYAQKIQKNTAEFTLKDFAGYMKWWLKQQPRKDLINMKSNYKQDLAAMQKYRKEQAEATENGIRRRRLYEPVEVDIIQDEEAEETEEVSEDVVCTMGLTKEDVTALLFAISRVFEDYEMSGHKYGASLAGIKEGLEGVE